MKEIAGKYKYIISGDEQLDIQLSLEKAESNIELLHIKMHSDNLVSPNPVKISWEVPICDITGIWYPNCDAKRNIQPPWGQYFESCSTIAAPVMCFFGHDHNRCTVAASDAMNVLRLFAAANEHTACLNCYISFFDTPTVPFCDYSVTIRFDSSDILYCEALGDVSRWWESLEGYKPSSVPEYARLPMYSTWYSFHQKLTPAAIERQCVLAKGIGCETVIVDDGWQTEDTSQGYAFCGDWQVCGKKIDDMAAHVSRIHDIGLKYMLWYSVPFVGYKAKCLSRFKSMLLYNKSSMNAFTLDPRYKEVREYLINTYESALHNWNIDGFKLDFVDRFTQPSAEEETPDVGRDDSSVPHAVDTLLENVIGRLRGFNKDIMIEFRQRYIGPLMRKYGNMFRASDCPNDPVMNRIRTIDIRLLCGSTAAHSDMLMWNKDEPVEAAALHVINILFSVPQISVLLDEIPQSHIKMLKFYLKLWRDYRDVLLDGKLIPYSPELLYPLCTAENDSILFAVLYGEYIVNVNKKYNEIISVNGTAASRVIIDFTADCGEYKATVYDCTGCETENRIIVANGLVAVNVPPSGTLKLMK